MNRFQKILLDIMNALYDRFGNYIIAGCFIIPTTILIEPELHRTESNLISSLASIYFENFRPEHYEFLNKMVFNENVKKAGILAAKEVAKLARKIAKETALQTAMEIPLPINGKKNLYLSIYFILKSIYRTKNGI